MKQLFTKSVITTAMATTLILSGAVSAYAADRYLAVKAREGLTLYFSVVGSDNVAFFNSAGNGTSHRSEQGWYFQKLPADLSLSKMDRWCVLVLEPDELFEEGDCSDVTADDLPEDGIFKLVLDL